MEAVIEAARAIELDEIDVAVAGGMESMTNAPYLDPKARAGARMGNVTLIDAMVHDGLWDVYSDQHMGLCAEKCAEEQGFSRADQDAFAKVSTERAQAAQKNGAFAAEIAPIEVPQRKGPALLVSEDAILALSLSAFAVSCGGDDDSSKHIETQLGNYAANDIVLSYRVIVSYRPSDLGSPAPEDQLYYQGFRCAK